MSNNLIMSNFSSPGQCRWNCFHSCSFLLTLLRSSSVALTTAGGHGVLVNYPEAVLWPSLHLCWAPSLVRVRPRPSTLASGPGPKSSSQTCSAAFCSTAASKRGLCFLSGVKNTFQLKFKQKRSQLRTETWSLFNFLWNTVHILPSSISGIPPFNLIKTSRCDWHLAGSQ